MARKPFLLPAGVKERLLATADRVAGEWPLSSGRDRYVAYLRGSVLGYADAVKAKCAECCHGYIDGKADCGVWACPLYPLMSYRGKA